MTLLGSDTSNVAESAASVLTACCSGSDGGDDNGGQLEQATAAGVVADAGAAVPLAALLGAPQRSRREAALETLAALCRASHATSASLLQQHPGVVPILLRAIKLSDGCSPHARFAAAVCLASLSCHLPAAGAAGEQASSGVQHSRQDVQLAVLPVLVRSLGAEEEAPGVLCRLLAGNDELQQAAADADAVAKLASILRRPGAVKVAAGELHQQQGQGEAQRREKEPQLQAQQQQQHQAAALPCRSSCLEGVLHCLAMLTADREDHRRALVESQALPQARAGAGARARGGDRGEGGVASVSEVEMHAARDVH